MSYILFHSSPPHSLHFIEKTMEQNEKPVAFTMDHRSNIDTSRPFSSVKDAVAIFGERSLVGEIYSPKPFTPSPHNIEKESSWKYSSPSPGVPSYSCNKLAETVKKLKIELQETKVELKSLKEREIEAEVALASLKAELHKNMSKLARAEAAMASAASSRLMMSVRGQDIDYGKKILRGEEKKRERVVRMESNPSLALAQTLSVGEKEEGSFAGRKKETIKLTKRKPIIPLIGDLLFRKKGSPSTLQSTSYASS